MPAALFYSLSLWPRTLQRKAAWALLLVFLLALGNVAVLQVLLRRSDDLAATLNMAGKMRMLGQRVALESLAARQDPQGAWAQSYPERVQAFEQAQHTLSAGGGAFGLRVSPLPAPLRPALSDLQASWQECRQALQAVQAAPAGQAVDIGPAMRASAVLLQHTEVLMDGIVAYANAAHQRALYSSVLLFVLDALLLLLGYVLVARRVLQPMHRLAQQCRAMVAGDYAQRAPAGVAQRGDELGELAQALNQSAAHIGQLLQDVAQERAAAEQIQAMFNGLAANSVAGIYMLDHEVRLIYANDQLAQLTGYTQQDLENHLPMARLFTPQAYAEVEKSVQDRLQGRTRSARYERRLLRADGSEVDIEIFGTAMRYQGRPAVIGLIIDISERKRAEASMRRASLVFQHTREAIVVTDARSVVQDINPAFTQITGYAAPAIVGRRMNVLSSGAHGPEFYQGMWQRLLEAGHWSGDITNHRADGQAFISELTITASRNADGSVHSYIGLFNDVTEQRQQQASIWRQAHYDHLTQLPNRQMFQQNLVHSMEQARHSRLPFALVFLDLDFFKEVNDTFGHDQGDELLRQVARRLRGCVRATDLIARLGGDEFTLILPGLQAQDDVLPVCRKVLQAIAQPYDLSSNTVHISVSMGVTFYPDDGSDGVELLKHADLAMYAAKDKGRNQFALFEAGMQAAAQQRRLLLRDLQAGLEQGEFVLHYQPIVEMRSQRTVKAEALLRWQRPGHGLVGPGEFIDLAEESSLIVPLGDWVFHEAARQVAQWRAAVAPAFSLSVNVSPVQLGSSAHQVARWLAHLQALALPGGALTLEITERVLLDADQTTDSKLHQLQNAGLQLALDDFGTGYSSLSYLKRFDIDGIKIDRSFVSHLQAGSQDLVLCQAIIVMAHQLGITVVAEGVETQAQHELLLAAGCDYGQGYFYCRPVPAEVLLERLQREALAATASAPAG